MWKTEEKGSDVNLGVHLIRDAFRGSFDAAAVLTNDTDLEEPIRIAARELGKTIVLLTPTAKPAASLAKLVSQIRHIQPYIGPCQLPNQITSLKGRLITKPAGW